MYNNIKRVLRSWHGGKSNTIHDDTPHSDLRYRIQTAASLVLDCQVTTITKKMSQWQSRGNRVVVEDKIIHDEIHAIR